MVIGFPGVCRRGEEHTGNSGRDAEPPSVGASLVQSLDAGVLDGPLVLQGLADLLVLQGDDGRVLVTITVVLDEDLAGLLVAILVDQPARAFRDERQGNEAEHGGQKLQLEAMSVSPPANRHPGFAYQRRQTPGPSRLDVLSPVCDASRDQAADVPRRAVQTSEHDTVLGMSDLGDVAGRRVSLEI